MYFWFKNKQTNKPFFYLFGISSSRSWKLKSSSSQLPTVVQNQWHLDLQIVVDFEQSPFSFCVCERFSFFFFFLDPLCLNDSWIFITMQVSGCWAYFNGHLLHRSMWYKFAACGGLMHLMLGSWLPHHPHHPPPVHMLLHHEEITVGDKPCPSRNLPSLSKYGGSVPCEKHGSTPSINHEISSLLSTKLFPGE